MKPPLDPKIIAALLKAYRAKRSPWALIRTPETNGIGGSWVRK